MRLALFTDSNIFHIDGVGRIVQELVNYVKGHPRHSLQVFHRGDRDGKAEPFGNNVMISSIAARYVHVPTYEAYPFFYLSNPRRRLLELTREFRPDLLLTFTPYVPRGIGRSTLYISEKLGVPLVGSFDVPLSWYSEYYARKVLKAEWAIKLWHRYASWLMKSYQRCVTILVPSKCMGEYVKELLGDVPCVMFPRAVDSEKFAPRSRDDAFKSQYGIAGKLTILYLGRLALEKNLGALVELYGNLKGRHSQIALVVVGEGPERKQLEARRLPDLLLTGALYGEDLRRAYASADIFAFPSVVDAGPMVILEAMASGLPVVVPNRGGAQDCISDGETGFIVQDMREFETRVEQLILDDRLRTRIGVKARRYAEAQSWERILDQLMVALDELSHKPSP